MKSNEYYRASLRHIAVCEELCTKLDNEQDTNMHSYLLQEIYYLSGYVIETALSWAIYQQYGGSDDVKASDIYKQDKKFKTHNLTLKTDCAKAKHNCIFPGVPFIDKPHRCKTLQNYFTYWDTDVRCMWWTKGGNLTR